MSKSLSFKQILLLIFGIKLIFLRLPDRDTVDRNLRVEEIQSIYPHKKLNVRLKQLFVCSRHYDEKFIELDSVGRRKLKKGALPNGLDSSINENDKRLLTPSSKHTSRVSTFQLL